MSFDILNPPRLGPPRGWNHGLLAPAGGRLLLIAGQVASDDTGRVAPADFATQFGRAIDNVLAVVDEAGGEPQHIGRITVFVTDIDAYKDSLKRLGDVWRQRMGRHYPAMALVQVSRLLDEHAVLEIEATAVIPPPSRLQDDSPAPSLA